MRISDWSSDVCSSDLSTDFPRACASFRGCMAALRRLAVRAGGRCAASACAHLAFWMSAEKPYHARLGRTAVGECGCRMVVASEIGREPGRAGVCQYVEFSVCAVSFKKKIAKNTRKRY